MSGSFITIVTNTSKSFPWQFTDPDTGRKADTVFELRILGEDEVKRLREKYTERKWKRGVQTEHVNREAFAVACVNLAIVGWTNLKDQDRNDVPCTPEMKMYLPERLQAEVIRLCVGKELGNALAEDTEEDAVPATEGQAEAGQTRP